MICACHCCSWCIAHPSARSTSLAPTVRAVGSFGQLQNGSRKFKANFDVNYTVASDEYPSSVPSTVPTHKLEYAWIDESVSK